MIISDTQIPTLAQVLELYQQRYLDVGILAFRTKREYRNDLKSVIAFLVDRCGLVFPTQVTRVHLEAYLEHLEGNGYSGAARRRQYASIRSFFLFLLAQESILADPTAELPVPERDERSPRVLTETEYRHLQLVVRQNVSTPARRDCALIELLLETGLRLCEVSRLTLADLDLPPTITNEGPSGAVRVIRRGRTARTLPLTWQACQAIRAYLAIRPQVADPTLFISKFQTGMSSRSIERTVAKHLAAAGIHDASVHTLRHTFAVTQVKNRASLETVQELLGHASPDTIQIYVNLASQGGEKAMEVASL